MLGTPFHKAAHPRQAGHERCIYYLEVLEEEHWALNGKKAPHPSDARKAYAKACHHRDQVRDHPPAKRDDAGERMRKAEHEVRTAESVYLAELTPQLHDQGRSALCFSGGGIRSATFGLGVLEGLACLSEDSGGARPKLLGEFDYLSTVSGGGYLGAWLSAWATRESKPSTTRLDRPTPDECDGTAIVIRQLAHGKRRGFEPEPDPVRYLRAFSNYLTPKLGLLSGDTWAAVGAVIRNMFLNWLVLLPLLAAVLLIPITAREIVNADIAVGQWLALIAGFGLGAIATAYVGFDLPSAGNARLPAKWFARVCLAPLTLSAICLNVFWAWVDPGSGAAAWWDVVSLGTNDLNAWYFCLFGAAMHAGGMLIGLGFSMLWFRPPRPAPKTGLIAIAVSAITGAIGGAVALVFANLVPRGQNGIPADPDLYTCFAFPTVMGIFLLAGTLLVGGTSYITEDKDREWWARSGGWFLAVTLAWPAFAAIVLYSRQSLQHLNMQLSAAFTGATALTGWAAAKLGSSADTPSGRREQALDFTKLSAASWTKELAARMVFPVFLVLIVMLLSLLNYKLLLKLDELPPFMPSLWPPSVQPLGDALAHILWLVLAYAVVCGLASIFINVNSFSMHAMYRQRLIRAYLGASNTRRNPHWFTGFDENDNVQMCALTRSKPMHIVNMALNLVGGDNLAWQQRKAEPFTASRLHAGSSRVGYRPAEFYGGRTKLGKPVQPLSLGTAMTISGAAASPNMGYNSSPLLTLVMMLFNARLGWWLGNPRDESTVWEKPGPNWGIRPFIDEAFGLTDDTNAWVYLSDGGHFENLGLYEMVLRRCKYIVVCDAGADPDYKYEDLGNAVRKIRIDLGIAIDFDTPMPDRVNGRHWALGRIEYRAIDGAEVEDGTMLYIKASMSGDEPADVLHYAATNKEFPHEATSNQFFNESQFESYRRLGLHIVESICRGAPLNFEEFIDAARRYAAQ